MAEETETHEPPGGGKKKDKRTWIIIGLSVVGLVIAYVTYRAVAGGGAGQTSAGVTSLPAQSIVPSSAGGGGGGSSSTSTGSSQAMSLASQQLASLQAQNSSLISDLISTISSGKSATSSTSPSSTTSSSAWTQAYSGAPSTTTVPANIPATPRLTTPSGYQGAGNIQGAIAAYRSGETVLARNNTTGRISRFVPGSGKTPKGATLFVPKGG